jgi:hypothetical protein
VNEPQRRVDIAVYLSVIFRLQKLDVLCGFALKGSPQARFFCYYPAPQNLRARVSALAANLLTFWNAAGGI